MDLARYVALFRSESREHLAAIDESLAQLAAGAGREAVDALFRSTHTIKGMAGAMGYEPVESLAHAIESRLGQLRATAGDLIESGRALVPLLDDATRALAGHVEDAVEGRTGSPPHAILLERLANVPAAEDTGTNGAQAAAAQQSAHRDVLPGTDARADATASERVPSERSLRTREPRLRDAVRQVRVEVRHLDGLLDIAGELVIARDRLLRVAEASGDRDVLAAARDTARLVGMLQDGVLEARTVPVGQALDRLPRVVRETARELGKSVELELEGRELSLDRALLDALADPLLHLLRNAIDHGLEPEAERRAAGKPAAGRLLVQASREREHMAIAVTDDGRGIDRVRVRARAVAEGRLPMDTPSLSDEALLALLAQPGFTTAATVSTVSGRGVGIDVVASRMRALGGSLELSTAPARGTTFTMRLPATLAIVRALLVDVAEGTYAVPASHVIEAVEFDDVDRTEDATGEAVVWRDGTLPLVRLRRVFGNAPGSDAGTQLLVVDAGGRRVACAVDAVLAQQEIVVKPFTPVRGSTVRFGGATILGDGRPALIVDVGSLA